MKIDFTPISIKAAARLAGMEYEAFRWWVNKKRGPKVYYLLGRVGFNPEEVKKWKPVYLPRGGDRYGPKLKHD